MHTPVTSETLHRPTALLEPEAPGASGALASQQKGIPLVSLFHLGNPAPPRWVGNTFRRGIKVIRQLKDKSHVMY